MSKRKVRRPMVPDQRQGPRPYKGQNPKDTSDPYSYWHDLSNPQCESPTDIQDAVKNTDSYDRIAGIRWFR
jgi:5-methylcytosine-specific restriction endonuclease McrA